VIQANYFEKEVLLELKKHEAI